MANQTFIALTNENMAAAIKRAKADKPFVRATVHKVEFKKVGALKLGSCDCAHVAFKGTPCRHLAAAVGYHIQRMSEIHSMQIPQTLNHNYGAIA